MGFNTFEVPPEKRSDYSLSFYDHFSEIVNILINHSEEEYSLKHNPATKDKRWLSYQNLSHDQLFYEEYPLFSHLSKQNSDNENLTDGKQAHTPCETTKTEQEEDSEKSNLDNDEFVSPFLSDNNNLENEFDSDEFDSDEFDSDEFVIDDIESNDFKFDRPFDIDDEISDEDDEFGANEFEKKIKSDHCSDINKEKNEFSDDEDNVKYSKDFIRRYFIKKNAEGIISYVIKHYQELSQKRILELMTKAESIILQLLKEAPIPHLADFIRFLNVKVSLELLRSETFPISVEQIVKNISLETQKIYNLGGFGNMPMEVLEEYANSFHLKAQIFEKNESYNAAITARQQEESIRNIIWQQHGISTHGILLCVIIIAKAADYNKLGDYDAELEFLFQAEEILEKVIDAEPDFLSLKFNIYYRRALAFQNLGRCGKAVDTITAIMEEETCYVQGKNELINEIFISHLLLYNDMLIRQNRYKDSLLCIDFINEQLANVKRHCDQGKCYQLWFYYVVLAEICRDKAILYRNRSNHTELRKALVDGLSYLKILLEQFGFNVWNKVVYLATEEATLLEKERYYEESCQLTRQACFIIEYYQKKCPQLFISLYPKLLRNEASLLPRLDRWEEAGPVWDKCVEYLYLHVVENGNLKWQRHYAFALNERGTWFLQYRHNYQKALLDFSRSVAIFDNFLEEEVFTVLPALAEATINLARALLLNQKENEALTALESRFQRWTNLYTERKIVAYHIEYIHLFSNTLNLLISLRSIEEAESFFQSNLQLCLKMKDLYLSEVTLKIKQIIAPESVPEKVDPLVNPLDLQALLEAKQFLSQLPVLLQWAGFNEIFFKRSIPLKMELLESLHLQMGNLIVHGETSLIPKDMFLLNQIEKKDHKKAIDLLQTIVYDVLHQVESVKETYSMEFFPIFETFLSFGKKDSHDKKTILRAYDAISKFLTRARQIDCVKINYQQRIQLINNRLRKLAYCIEIDLPEEAMTELSLLHVLIEEEHLTLYSNNKELQAATSP